MGIMGTYPIFLDKAPWRDRVILMPRALRGVVAGCPHHVTQRGNNRQDVFFVDDDRRVFVELLRESTIGCVPNILWQIVR